MSVLAFNLSAWPSLSRANSTNLSSQSSDATETVYNDCDQLRDRMASSGELTGECQVKVKTDSGKVLTYKFTGKVNSHVTYDLVTGKANPEQRRIDLTGDLESGVTSSCDGTCPHAIQKNFDINTANFADLAGQLSADKAEADAQKLAEEHKNEVRHRHELEGVEDCLLNPSSHEPLSDQGILDCRIDKLNAMDDRAKAARYFDENLQPKLIEMMKSGSKADRKIVRDLIGRSSILMVLARNNPHIQNGLKDLSVLDEAQRNLERGNQELAQVTEEISNLPANNPRRQLLEQRRRALVARLRDDQQKYDDWYSRRKAAYKSEQRRIEGAGSTFLDSNNLTSIDDYRAALDQAYADVNAMFEKGLGITKDAGDTNGRGTGRQLRGWGSQNYNGGPDNQIRFGQNTAGATPQSVTPSTTAPGSRPAVTTSSAARTGKPGFNQRVVNK
jgi:hypothetical protein